MFRCEIPIGRTFLVNEKGEVRQSVLCRIAASSLLMCICVVVASVFVKLFRVYCMLIRVGNYVYVVYVISDYHYEHHQHDEDLQ